MAPAWVLALEQVPVRGRALEPVQERGPGRPLEPVQEPELALEPVQERAPERELVPVPAQGSGPPVPEEHSGPAQWGYCPTGRVHLVLPTR